MKKENELFCKRCQELKHKEDFHRNKTKKGGHMEFCKPCRSEYRREIGQYDRNRFYKMKFEAKKAGVVDDLTMEEFLEILATPEICVYCGAGPNGKQKHAFEHVIPLHQKGPHSKNNIVKSCKSCNSTKGHYDLMSFLDRSATLTAERLQTIIDDYVKNNGPTAGIYAISFESCQDLRKNGGV
jgi:hypothetical protein